MCIRDSATTYPHRMQVSLWLHQTAKREPDPARAAGSGVRWGENFGLNELYASLRLMTNFFSPQMKLREKTRDGARVTKRYDEAKTPYQRLLQAAVLPEDCLLYTSPS